jgi:epoxyqueuosine reductase
MVPLEQQLKQQALTLGFDLVGIASATPADSFDRLSEWLQRGFAGAMGYMVRHAAARRDPASILPNVRSVVMVGMNYNDQEPEVRSQEPESKRGRVARYARGLDYHDVLKGRLKQLLEWVQGEVPDCRGRGVVDTAPLLERDFARRAGLGWFGKNTMLINKRLGSYFFLGALLLDIELRADSIHETSHCGTCTACLDACPTGAFAAAGELDSRKCISYLTIELRRPIPAELRSEMGDWLFGCDVCQEVCPWNRKAPSAREPAWEARPDLQALDPAELLDLSEEAFRQRFRGTALMRPGRSGLLRNAAIVLGNSGAESALPALRRALADPDPVIREAAQWAVAEIDGRRPTGTSSLACRSNSSGATLQAEPSCFSPDFALEFKVKKS